MSLSLGAHGIAQIRRGKTTKGETVSIQTFARLPAAVHVSAKASFLALPGDWHRGVQATVNRIDLNHLTPILITSHSSSLTPASPSLIGCPDLIALRPLPLRLVLALLALTDAYVQQAALPPTKPSPKLKTALRSLIFSLSNLRRDPTLPRARTWRRS